MRFYFSLKILVIGMLLNACNGQNTPPIAGRNADTLVYNRKIIDEHSNYFLKDDNRLDTTYFRAKYPVFQEDKINKLIANIVHLEGDTSMQNAANRFINSYNEYVEDNSGKSTATWNRDLQIDVIANTAVFLGLRTKQEEYTGGAHGDHFTLYSNFDRQSNKPISIDDVIQKENKDKFVKIAEQYFRKQEGLSDDDSFNGKYFFEDGKFSLADNFTFEKDDILFYYNVYEIKSYAEGNTELRIPYTTFKHLISDKGLRYINSIN
ncbi:MULTISPECIES: DUF3298 and DUF4163 domain-containing protein [unclassified Sphingobacterium]|jgi:hypothetical protein|uniref:DUF3298 and DUF4163 domain-containing protein n=2 Tax=Sphingobacterium TaxID=28453 RepID=UPI002955969E|nr:DUF3298 domain-containing protein [Sphingobacterium sp. UGAL515B_05]WON93855.1 DUF3298 and DUF4163 domain-containing protein [Sphingobacterium sp. UGAL515B_05]